MMKLLGIAPKFEKITSYSFKWYEELIEKLKDHAKIKELKEENAVREKFEDQVKNEDFDIIIFYDHGEDDKLIGNNRKAVVDSKNVDLLKGKVLYTMACNAGSKLGVLHYQNNGIFWGYNKEFVFTESEEELFKECSNHGALVAIADNKSWEEAYDDTIKKFNESMKKAKLLWTKIWLQHDRDSLVLYSKKRRPRRKKSWIQKVKEKIRSS